MALIPLELVQKVANYKFNTSINIEGLTEGTFHTSGNVTYATATQKYQRAKYFLVDRAKVKESQIIVPKKIGQVIARRLVELGHASTLFTLDIWKNAAFIPYFSEIASLQDILGLRERWSFKQRHVKILVDDILAGISSLHTVRLQKGSFSVKDILLVRGQYLFYFQIAGLEDCKCLDGSEPTDSLELQSLREILHIVGGRNEADRSDLIPDLISTLSNAQVLGSKELAMARERVKVEGEKQREEYERLLAEHEGQKSKHEAFPPWGKDIDRVELEEYFDAMRVLGTTIGGTFVKKEVIS